MHTNQSLHDVDLASAGGECKGSRRAGACISIQAVTLHQLPNHGDLVLLRIDAGHELAQTIRKDWQNDLTETHAASTLPSSLGSTA